MGNNTGAWSEAEITLASAQWLDGKSAREVAAQLPGRTKNAVIGMMHRKGFLRPQADKERIVRQVRRRTPRPAAAPTPRPAPKRLRASVAAPALLELTPDTAKPLMERGPLDCCWPVPGGEEQLFCGGLVTPGRRYCPGHLAIGFRPQTVSQDRATARLLAFVERPGRLLLEAG